MVQKHMHSACIIAVSAAGLAHLANSGFLSGSAYHTDSLYDCVLPFSFDAILVAAPSASRPADVAIARVYTVRGAVVKQRAVYMYVLYIWRT